MRFLSQGWSSIDPHRVIQPSFKQEIGQQATHEENKMVYWGRVESKRLRSHSNFLFDNMLERNS